MAVLISLISETASREQIGPFCFSIPNFESTDSRIFCQIKIDGY